MRDGTCQDATVRFQNIDNTDFEILDSAVRSNLSAYRTDWKREI